jgi:predicted transposase/invertase (TIGR01784 family)
MRRDSIFYKLFKFFPGLLFDLTDPPPASTRYRFDSITVKETELRIDGVFLPPDTASPRIVYFAEVQFQKDEALYDRFFTEIFLFLRQQQPPYDDWHGVLIYGSRSLEPRNAHLYRSLLTSEQVTRIYLNEIARDSPYAIGIQLMLLTIVPDAEALPTAHTLIDQAPTAATPRLSETDILEMIATIMSYRYRQLSWEEIRTMLDLDMEEPRAFREAREEGERSLALRILTRKLGDIPASLCCRIDTLTLDQLNQLGEDLLDFQTLSDLETWLAQQLN